MLQFVQATTDEQNSEWKLLNKCKLELLALTPSNNLDVSVHATSSKVCETKSLAPASNRMTETDTMILQM